MTPKKSAGKKSTNKGKSQKSSARKTGGNGAKAAKGTHTIHEADPWTENVGNHPERKDSPEYTKARKILIKIVETTQPWYLGEKPYQDHHGGGLWVKDEEGWFLLKNLAGMEWSSQFCADPKKVDFLRRNAKRLYAKFPLTAIEFKKWGFDLDKLLNTPITDTAGIEKWTDSICNASVPLPQGKHTGTLPKDGGVHHYPTPITDIELFKRDDFQLWVTDDEGKPAATVPVAHHGSGDSRVHVMYATPGTKLHKQQQAAEKKNKKLVLSHKHPIAKKAFEKQASKPAKRKTK
jgi:Family of unknown function (DUF6424)